MSAISSISNRSVGSSSQIDPAAKELGKDDFLKLMVAQMQYQNPLEPMSNEDFVLQLTQLSTMEQLQNVSGSLENMSDVNKLTNAASMIGKQVTYRNEAGEFVSGMVSAVNVDNGTISLAVGEQSVGLASIVSVEAMPTVASK